VLVLGLALAAVTTLAVYLAANKPTAAAIPGSDSGIVYSGTVAEHPCYQPQVAW